MFRRPNRAHAWRAGSPMAAALVGFCACARVTGLSDYDEAVEGQRLYAFDSDTELETWQFAGCEHERSSGVGGQNPGALELSATSETCLASTSIRTQRPAESYSQLAIWLRSEDYDAITIALDGVNNRLTLCAPDTSFDAKDCTVSPSEGDLTPGVLQQILFTPAPDGGRQVYEEISELTISLTPKDDRAVLYIDDIWLR